ncbi:uncharacterized protein LOC129768083 isoform X1 [Toxorhynchites rutilus septentrionalis]|uniref:uncharacterized protein LOC129768083 isoform X1 n=1 Tax=Toxorhynchites rutilus septentrionalis TaxID=329112 RepID=UPI0024789562|nr:uncharacterized protein LOC129768083 isoform X1 [Toxorhynchites rutilus septentrionalis]
MYSYYYLVVMLFHLSWMISAETEDDFQTSTLPPADSYPYCFRFTWLGPKYNKDSPFKNVTCENLLKKATGIPCFHPLVVTNNSNVPDTEYMWNEYKDKPTQIGCRLVRGEVCARFTYRYNGAIENITYMCAKMNVDNESSTTSTCYTEDRSGRDIEVCVCESAAGRTPCNRSSSIILTHIGQPVVLVIVSMLQLMVLRVCLVR